MVAAPAHLTGRRGDEAAANERCPISRTLGILGARSAILIMREAHYGTTRFDDFARRVDITESVAAARLRELVEAGLLARRPYQDPGQRVRHEYVLTDAGADLMPMLLALVQWGERHLASRRAVPLRLTHSDCGAAVSVQVRCADDHDVRLDELTVEWPRRGRS